MGHITHYTTKSLNISLRKDDANLLDLKIITSMFCVCVCINSLFSP
jgi:hypothetical protein